MRHGRSLVGGALLVALLGTAVPAAGEPDPEGLRSQAEEAESDAEDVQDDLSSTIRSLDDLNRAIEDAERELAAAQSRLQEATAALAGLEEEIAEAEAAVASAEAAHDDAQAEVERAESEAAQALVELEAADARLHRRAIEVYKYGAGIPQQTLVTGVVGANDWHEVAVTTQSVSRIVSNDRDLLDVAESLRGQALLAEEEAELARTEAAAAEDAALDEAAELQVLLEEQEAAVAEVEAEETRREEMLRSFEEDEELMAQVAARLESEVAEYQRTAARLEEEASDAEAAEAAAEAEAARAAEEEARREAARAEQEATSEPPEEDSAEPPPEPEVPSDLAWASGLPSHGQQYAQAIASAASSAGIDARLLAGLVWCESAFNPNAVSHAGAQGLTQLMPGTAAMLGVSDPFDPQQNLNGGASYLAMRINQFGSVELGLAAYNAGANRVIEAGYEIPDILETQLYVPCVLGHYNRLAG